MSFVQVLATATISGLVSGVTVVFVLARLSCADPVPQKGADEITMVRQLPPERGIHNRCLSPSFGGKVRFVL
ncbi:hypothetical protein A3I99_01560 [Candidatus Kaiserbacteria bacterium RIFCSPLOWO2_02_FULL_45_11b]|uniref:Uncharacterized protein n=1 Tax=Candidatus Kaiserbacteria bacterium RIFCSPLOWO2_12_FULL_45_26 TaxID=1798525 RepID=A0A1F6FFV3_9BACT|nr:MAG: hypothetical protein A2Z56_03900 [Candidatus Kaiserbacteria bacterium RIFCSPHIGHO2_12_45_16]OGG70517.1 MAG: hypothetical protein A2929_04805 [Candidatus Kaiserbacteria bacterium RIFCSPLOWO2_01_FULL_45_25]OGG81002.1 MAG: hypothetical protein A3I99_01560 [Candidatus Kaiserbacteria bacterium RIFCSPLOWO2_02_FULL_45_11b]OGG84745.1 MAG: hypothetical protein A3G90_01510 [Candidatus Kaiserbacteria bacterium RIFCSPLOWO2_12_FULL_45_26]